MNKTRAAIIATTVALSSALPVMTHADTESTTNEITKRFCSNVDVNNESALNQCINTGASYMILEHKLENALAKIKKAEAEQRRLKAEVLKTMEENARLSVGFY